MTNIEIQNSLLAISADIAVLAGKIDTPVVPPPVDPPPRLVVSAGQDVLTEVEKTITLTAVATGGTSPVNVRWAVNGLTYPGSTVTLSFPKMGTYVATCEAVDAVGNRATDDVSISVKGVTPPLATTIHCGPGTDFLEPHLVPFNSLQPNTKVNILYRQAPYLSKLVLQRSDVTITGLSGPNGELPILDGTNATENQWQTDWTSQLVGKGLISIIKRGVNDSVNNVVISGLELRNANRSKMYNTAVGVSKQYAEGTAGVYAITCDGLEIIGCKIANNDNGVFATTNSAWQGVNSVRNLKLRWNHFLNNGVPGSFLQHGVYVEGIGTVYEMNTFDRLISGASGSLLKDRGAGTTIAYNHFTGPSTRLMDLVEPEAGASILKASDKWGKTFVHSNIIRNNLDCAYIHFGYDGTKANTQEKLYFYHNTCVNTGDNWKFQWFKVHSAPSAVTVFNSIFWNNSTDAARMYSADGSGVDWWIQGSWLSTGTSQTFDPNSGAPLNPGMPGWLSQTFGGNPGVNADGTLAATSPCRGIAVPLEWIPSPVPIPVNGWNGSMWVRRASWLNCGAAAE